MDESQIQTSPITPDQHQIILQAIHFIAQIAEAAKAHGCRVIISGGYAVDGALGVITRPHDDIDIQIYGRDTANETVKNILNTLNPSLLSSLIDKGRKEFWHYYHLRLEGCVAEIYYLQTTTDPFAHEKIILKSDGTQTPSHQYHTKRAKFEGHEYEIQHPRTELADKLYKRTVRKDEAKTKHDQDMANLLLITDPKEVEGEFEMMKTRSS